MPDTLSLKAPSAGPREGALASVYLRVLRLERLRAGLLAAGLGALSNLAFPPVHIWPTLAVGLCGLVWLLDGARRVPNPGRAAFFRTFCFGFAYFLVGLHWIAAAFLVEAERYALLIWLPLVLLPGGLALILAAGVSVGFRFWSEGPARLVSFALAFTLAEWVRGALFGIGGLPWNLPGMVWAPGGAISQSASIWGIYGLSLLTVAGLASPAMLADPRLRGVRPVQAAPVIAAAILFGALWGYGARRLSEAPDGAAGPVVRLVEVGVPQAQKYNPEVAPLVVRRFLDLTGQERPGAPPVVIWPEGALPYYLFEWPEVLDAVTAQIGARELIVGLVRREAAGTPDERAYNSLAVLGSDSVLEGPRAIYDKHMLVPFGEFTPLAGVADALGIGTLQKLSPGGFAAGDRPAPMPVRGSGSFAPLICYEAIFPGLAPAGAERASWLVNISNDSWFGHLSGPHQHAAQARYRSIEEGLPMARVAAGGHTGVIDAYGRWTARGAPADPAIYGADPPGWRSSVVDAAVPAAAEPTPYSRWRDGLFWLMALALGLAAFILPRR
jgi:apolipoprotein N-acyltransferase